MDILLKEEHVQIDKILGHGGLFKTKGVGQGILAAAIDTPVSGDRRRRRPLGHGTSGILYVEQRIR